MRHQNTTRCARWLSLGLCSSLLLLAAAPAAQAQSLITVYENDFETINTESTACTRFGGSWSSGTLSVDYGTAEHPFTQIGSADRLCLNNGTDHSDSWHVDSSGVTGKYAVGFHGGDGREPNIGIEAFGLVLDPQGQPYLNASFLSSPLGVGEDAGWVDSTTKLKKGDSVPFTVSFYKVPVGATVSLAQNGYGNVVHARANGVQLTALHTESLSAVNNKDNLWHAEWTHHGFGVDTSSVASNERLFVVFSALPQWRYMGFDNLVFTAAQAQAAPPQISKQFDRATVSPGGTATLTIAVAGNNTGNLPGMDITDTLPAPLLFTGTAPTSTCGGTLTAAEGGNTLALTGGVLPATGCIITAEVRWPASALDQCTGAAVTNTIADGTDFKFSPAVPMSGVDATAQLACPAVPAPRVSKQFNPMSVDVGDVSMLTITVAGNGVIDLPGMDITDSLPAPLLFTGTAPTSSCGGTLTAAEGSNTLTLTGGVLPATGCTITAEVRWPASALDQCTGAAVTNTIVDGTDFGFTPAVATAGADATAQLACPAVAPIPANTPAGLFVLAAMLGLAAVLRQRRNRRGHHEA